MAVQDLWLHRPLADWRPPGTARLQWSFRCGNVWCTAIHVQEGLSHRTMVAVDDVDSHYKQARQSGAKIIHHQKLFRLESASTALKISAGMPGRLPSRLQTRTLKIGAER